MALHQPLPGIRECGHHHCDQGTINRLQQKFSSGTLTGGPYKSDTAQYIVLDAETTLSNIKVGNWPDEARFKTVIGEIMHQATKEGRQPVHAYGEMVALLCAEGKQDAAIRLEELWTDLQQEYPFSLLCGYLMGVFTKQEHSQSFETICRAHTHVKPVENHPAPVRDDEHHLTVAMLRQKTHALESEVARRTKIEEELHKKLQELAEVDRRKNEFLAMLGHELRNPLAPIMNALQLIRLQNNDMQQITRWRETIERQVALMTRLVDDLLDVSRITRGKIELKMEWIALDHTLSAPWKLYAR